MEESTRLIISAVSTVLKGGDEETDHPWQKVTAPDGPAGTGGADGMRKRDAIYKYNKYINMDNLHNK